MSAKKYKIIALMGEAGAGKDTLMQYYIKKYGKQKVHGIISCTSRPKREKERDGIHYFFYSKEEMIHKIQNKEMFEYTCFNNWYYGTSKESLQKDKINIGVFNPEGIMDLARNAEVDLKIIYVSASPNKRLIRQFSREKHPDIKEIIRRFNTDTHDFNLILNDSNILFSIWNNDNWHNAKTSIKNWVRENAAWLGQKGGKGKNI